MPSREELILDWFDKIIVASKRLLQRWPTYTANPIGTFSPRLIKESNNMAMIYELDLPALPENDPETPDVTNGGFGRVVLNFDGVDQPEMKTAIGDTVLKEVSVPKGVSFSGSFCFVDNDGNPSKNPKTFEARVASDTIPAPDPEGNFGPRLVREEPDTPPVV